MPGYVDPSGHGVLRRSGQLAFRMLNRILWRFGRQIRHTMFLDSFEPIFYRKMCPRFYFIEVGANDGRRADPLHELITRHNLEGLAVEPLPDIFEDLKRTYANYPKVKLANVAIHRTGREITLHRVRRDADHVADYFHGNASTNAKHHEKLGIADELMVTEVVPAMSLRELFKEYAVPKRIDLFQVDTEGYDAEIIRMLLETDRRPEIIRFEHGMTEGTMTIAEFWELGRLLMDEGYFILTEDDDAIAYKSTTPHDWPDAEEAT